MALEVENSERSRLPLTVSWDKREIEQVEVVGLDTPIHVLSRLATIPPFESLKARNEADECYVVGLKVDLDAPPAEFTVLVIHAATSAAAIIPHDNPQMARFVYKTKEGRIYSAPIDFRFFPPVRLRSFRAKLRWTYAFHTESPLEELIEKIVAYYLL